MVAIATTSNAAGRNASALECERNCGMVYVAGGVKRVPEMNWMRTLRVAAGFAAALALFVGGCGGGGGSTSPNGDDTDLLYEETFSNITDGSIPVGWQIITQATATQETPAEWRVYQGRLRQNSNIRAPSTPGLSYNLDYEGTFAIVGDTSWTNVSFRVEIWPKDDDAIGIVFRYRTSGTDPDGDFYRLIMVDDDASGGPKLRLDCRHNGAWEIIDEKTTTYGGYNKDNRYVLEVEMVVDDFTIKIDGTIVFEFSDATLGKGKVGLFCYAQAGAEFDNIKVYRRGP